MPALTPGKGGRQHKYPQHLAKGLGEELGFRAVIEERILDAAGQIDVALYRYALKIACEISVTTGSDHELRNVEKCFGAGFTHVIVIADEPRHLAYLRKTIAAGVEEAQSDKVLYCIATDLPATLKELAPAAIQEQHVRGLRVRVKRSSGDTASADVKRGVIMNVIARSLATKVRVDSR